MTLNEGSGGVTMSINRKPDSRNSISMTMNEGHMVKIKEEPEDSISMTIQ